MAGNIKGITIEFRGDTTKLEKALRQVRNDTKGIDKQLQDINKALKFNPKNVELLAQKQQLLKQKVDVTKKSLEDLKSAQAQMDAAGVDKTSDEYMALRREIIATESKVKTFEAQLRKANAEASRIGQVGKAWEDAGKKIESAGRSLRGVSMVSGAVFAGLSGITYGAASMADDLNTLSKQTGISTHDLQMYAATADLVDVSVEAMAKSQSKLKKSMLGASEGGSQAKYFEQLGISVTDANGNLRDSNDVFKETIAALGQMENETERDAIAMAIFGKSANELNPLIEDAGATYAKVSEMMSKYGLEPIDQEALDKANAFKDQIDTIKLVFTQAVQIIGTKIASTLLPVMEKVTEKAAEIAQKIAGMDGGVLTKIMALSGVGAALSPVLVVIGKLVTGAGQAMQKIALFAQKVPILGRVFGLLTNPILLVIGALAALGLAANKIGTDELQKRIETFAKYLVVKIPQVIDTVIQTITALMPVILEAIVTGLSTIITMLPTLLPVLIQAALTLFNGLVQAAVDILPVLIQSLVELINQVAAMLPTLVPMLMQAAVDLFMAIVDALPTLIPALIQAAITLIGALIAALPQMFVALQQTVVTLFQGLWKSITSVFSGVASWFGSIFGQAWEAVKRKFASWGAFWGGLWESIRQKFASIGTSIANAISGAVRSGINGVISRIESIINGGIGLINGAINLINKIPGVSIGKIGTLNLPRLAKGGVLNGAQTVIAGEAGPEAIIPLDKLFAQMDRMAKTIAGQQGAGDNIVVNVYGSEGQSVKALAEEVQRVIIETQKRRRLAWQ